MNFPPQLRIPGPTPVPDRVVKAISQPMINHRGPEFKMLLAELEAGLRWAFQTGNDILIFPASGTGGLESAVANLISPGERILAVTIGAFGNRFADLAEAFGADVQRYTLPWGEPADPEDVDEILAREPDIKTVLITHNETSTGVLNPIQQLAQVVKKHDRLLVVDGVSSIGSVDLPVDALGVDVAVTASQKGWMCPPGVTMLSISEKAWARQQESRGPRFYFDWKREKKNQAEGATFTTPAVGIFFGLAEALKMMREEGLQKIFKRHLRLSAAMRTGVRALGLRVFADEDFASPTVTAVSLPESLGGDRCKEFLRFLRERYNLVLAGGQGNLAGKMVRIGHMGSVADPDIIATITAMERGLADMGQPVKAGEAVRATQAALNASPAVLL